MNIENIKLLADFIEANVQQSQFDMETFKNCIDDIDNTNIASVKKFECGTTGCLVGWAASLPGAFEPKAEDFHKLGEFDYLGYSERVFNIETKSVEWDFLFGGEWRDINNSKDFAVKRLRYLALTQGSDEIVSAVDDGGNSFYAPKNFIATEMKDLDISIREMYQDDGEE